MVDIATLEDLDGHVSRQLEVLGPVDDADPTLTQDPEDAVAVLDDHSRDQIGLAVVPLGQRPLHRVRLRHRRALR